MTDLADTTAAANLSPHGWKTYLAAAAAIVGGASAVLVAHQYEVGFAGIVFGLGLIGVRGSAAKIIQVLQSILAKQ